jgi:hypothetical protein
MVSYPRSGQHYMQALLRRVTGVNDYCELYNCFDEKCPGKSLPTRQRSPCLVGRRFQKSHDFNLRMEVTDDFLYVALYRRPLFSITSYFELDTRSGKGVPLQGASGKQEWQPESQETWEQYAVEKAIYWRDFIIKWRSYTSANVHSMRYEEIVQDLDAVRRFFQFTFPTFDENRLNSEMKFQLTNLSLGKKTIRSLTDFRFPLTEQIVSRVRQEIGQEALRLAGYDDVL